MTLYDLVWPKYDFVWLCMKKEKQKTKNQKTKMKMKIKNKNWKTKNEKPKVKKEKWTNWLREPSVGYAGGGGGECKTLVVVPRDVCVVVRGGVRRQHYHDTRVYSAVNVGDGGPRS